MNALTSRRRFLGSLAAGSVAVLGAHRTTFAQPPRNLRIRSSALELPPNDPIFDKYAAAVKAMHELPMDDRRNWWQQAKIHADFCTHRVGEFLPWHRHYLNQFEKICGELIGDPTFALPYWDWTYAVGKIPDPFFTNMLLNVTHWMDLGQYSSSNWGDIDTIGIRAISRNVGVQNDPVRGGSFTSRTINSILGETTFRRFFQRLERTPHNTGHVLVGYPRTGKPGHIGSGLSPLDPIFWLHHCNVDRLWAQWQLAGNTQPNFGQQYNGQFADESGNLIDVQSNDAIDFSSLGYSYDKFPNPRRFLELTDTVLPANADQPLLDSFRPENRIDAAEPFLLGEGEPTEAVEVGIPTSVNVPVRDLEAQLASTHTMLVADLPSISSLPDPMVDEKVLAQFGKPRITFRRILARIRGVKAQYDQPPVVSVFLNCPYLSPNTPYSDTHYADTFAFFGNPDHDGNHEHDGSFVVDLTPAIQAVDLRAAKDLEFQLRAASADPAKPRGSFSFESVEIFSA